LLKNLTVVTDNTLRITYSDLRFYNIFIQAFLLQLMSKFKSFAAISVCIY
jgi:hypothetical protein